MTLTPTQQHFTKFYLAAFLRAPELGGLNYWVNQVQSGKSLQEVGGIIFSLPTVIDIYPANLSDTDFVEAIYHNVFGRSSDAEGLGYWTNEIASLRSNFAAQGSTHAAYEARGKLLMNMVDAGLATAEGTDGKAYIENRLDVAEYAIEQQLEQGREIAVTFLQDTLSQVNADDASVSAGQFAITHLLEDRTAPSLLSVEVTSATILSGTVSTGIGIYSLIQQIDGKFTVAGSALTYENGKSNSNFALARYNADGSLDTSFGQGDGRVMTDVAGGNDLVRSLIQQADGKLLLAGSVSGGGNNNNFAMVRYNLDGSLDMSFGEGDGKVTIDFAGSYDEAYSLIQQADDKLLLAGGTGSIRVLARYNLDGTLDNSFGDGDGKLGVNDLLLGALIQQPDGKLVVMGFTYGENKTNIGLMRLNLDGSLDTSFGGGDGTVSTDLGNTRYNESISGFANAVLQQTDGKLIVAGYGSWMSSCCEDLTTIHNSLLVRYNTDGSLDLSFGGGDGIVFDPFRYGFASINDLVQQADGKLLALESDGDLVRYNTDGSLDLSFGGGDGKVTTIRSPSHLIQQGDGKLVVTGDYSFARYNPDGTLDTSFVTEILGALAISSDEAATAGLYTGGGVLVGSTLSLDAHVAANLEVSAQTSVTQTSLRLTDTSGISSGGPAVALGTTGDDTISLSNPGYLFGFGGYNTLTGSSGADVFIVDSGLDTFNLGNDSAIDRVLFDADGGGSINGMVLGTGGDVLDFSAINLGELSLNTSIISSKPSTAMDISGQVLRILEGGDGLSFSCSPSVPFFSGDTFECALSGKYANLDMSANSSALILVQWIIDWNNLNQLYRVNSNDTGEIDSVALIGVIRNVDINLWTADNFAF